MAKLIARIEVALQEEMVDEKLNWRKMLGTAAVTGAAALAPMKAHAQPTQPQAIPTRAAPSELPEMPPLSVTAQPNITVKAEPEAGPTGPRAPMSVIGSWIKSTVNWMRGSAGEIVVEDIQYGKPMHSTRVKTSQGAIPPDTILYPIRVVFDFYGTPNVRNKTGGGYWSLEKMLDSIRAE